MPHYDLYFRMLTLLFSKYFYIVIVHFVSNNWTYLMLILIGKYKLLSRELIDLYRLKESVLSAQIQTELLCDCHAIFAQSLLFSFEWWSCIWPRDLIVFILHWIYLCHCTLFLCLLKITQNKRELRPKV